LTVVSERFTISYAINFSLNSLSREKNMASNIPSGSWRVKIVSIPASVTVVQLAQIIGLPKSRIYIPKGKSHDTHYAWINDFDNVYIWYTWLSSSDRLRRRDPAVTVDHRQRTSSPALTSETGIVI
jgi:hypothetical protein